MSFDPISDPLYPPPEVKTRRFGRLPRAAMAGGLAVGLAVGGAGIAFAASSSSSSTPSTTTPSNSAKPGHGPRSPGRGLNGPGGLKALGGLGQVVHGQFIERTAGGGYKTVEVQVGKASSVSATSITVTSTDGYVKTYKVLPSTVVDAQRGGIASVAGGDQVRVIATPGSGEATAANVVDTSKIAGSRAGFGFGFNPGRHGPRTGVAGVSAD